MVFEYFDLHLFLSLSFQKFSALLEGEIKGSTDRILINITEVIIIIIIIVVVVVVVVEKLYNDVPVRCHVQER